jgi:hypothetical protein
VFDRRILIATLLPALMVGGCNQKSAQGTSTVSGQVLPGSTSDDMLPADSLTSQPPIMAPEPDKGGPASGPAAATDPAAEGSEAATPDAGAAGSPTSSAAGVAGSPKASDAAN